MMLAPVSLRILPRFYLQSLLLIYPSVPSHLLSVITLAARLRHASFRQHACFFCPQAPILNLIANTTTGTVLYRSHDTTSLLPTDILHYTAIPTRLVVPCQKRVSKNVAA